MNKHNSATYQRSCSDSTIAHLQQLVSFDSQNPPRAITVDSDIFVYLKAQLPGFEFSMLDAQEGCISLLATRGKPTLLFNFHIDTVPIAPGWDSNPLELIVDEHKATALGACDIKGASACMLSAVAQSNGDVALLFSSDEEHGSSQAIKQFLATEHGFTQVIVAEPTLGKAVMAHRGIQSAKAHFKGISGHGSEKRAISDSAVHKSAHWMSAALQWASEQNHVFDTLEGLPFNIGKIDGGIKGNMIAATCEITFGFRPMPGQDSQQMLKQLSAASFCPLDSQDFTIEASFTGPTLPAANQDFATAIDKAQNLIDACQLQTGNAVNFWTEASLFSQAGLTAIVFGPGDIAQAHTANEWVALSQLAKVEQHYIDILNMQTTSPKG